MHASPFTVTLAEGNTLTVDVIAKVAVQNADNSTRVLKAKNLVTASNTVVINETGTTVNTNTFVDDSASSKGHVYIKSEGRLSDSMIARSGVDTDPAKWKVVPTNDYEFVTDMMRELIKDNDAEIKVIDTQMQQ